MSFIRDYMKDRIKEMGLERPVASREYLLKQQKLVK